MLWREFWLLGHIFGASSLGEFTLARAAIKCLQMFPRIWLSGHSQKSGKTNAYVLVPSLDKQTPVFGVVKVTFVVISYPLSTLWACLFVAPMGVFSTWDCFFFSSLTIGDFINLFLAPSIHDPRNQL